MEVLIAGLILPFCLAFVWLAARKTVFYAVRTAYLFHVSPLFIAFPILSLATGLPELAIAFHSLIIKKPMLSAGDIVGSNFIDVALILGLPALLMGPIISPPEDNRRHIGLIIVSIFLMASLFVIRTLNFAAGILLLVVYIMCMSWFWHTRKLGHFETTPEMQALKKDPKVKVLRIKSLLAMVLYIVLMMGAARIAVHSALIIAESFGLAVGVIGATIIALGTSLPELSITCNAVQNKEYSLAIGSALGSVLEQGTLILGLLGIFTPVTLDLTPILSIAPFLLVSYGIVAYGLMFRKAISRRQGGVMIGLYLCYLVVQFLYR